MIRLENLLLFLPVSVFHAYFCIYYLLPNYILKQKYLQLISILLLATALFMLLSYYITTIIDIRLTWDMPVKRATIVRQIDFTVNNGLVFPLTISGFATGIKMSKKFYQQQLLNEKLEKQKIDTQLQLLKGKAHPRFLFHSLNSIYKDMLHGAKQSPEMLLKLSDLLSYILYESDEIMPLKKEIALLKKYIDLEKMGRSDNCIVEVDNTANTKEKYIQPLLLLPLAEYIFSCVHVSDDAKTLLNVQMQTKESVFYFSLAYTGNMNHCLKDDTYPLQQVEQRLQAQYAGKYTFVISNDKNSFQIFLTIDLGTINGGTQ